MRKCYTKNMPVASCIFCRIIRGEVPSTKIYETDQVLAFLDINPVNLGHVVVIPKEHVDQFQDMEPKLYLTVMNVAQNISRKIKDALNPPRVGLMVWGFEVPHAHLHVVPLQQASDFTMRHVSPKPGPEQIEEVAAKLRMQ
jgi:diadenosine tetraphosphate (Ap4A) HIT family hydrolase